jgi:squalene synthase HpnC
MRLLPADLRRDLRAVYDVARVIDDLGDDAPGDRLRLLEEFTTDLRRVWSPQAPQSPVLRRLALTVAAHDLPAQPFLDLVQANVWDQHHTRYPTYADLLTYCTLSAQPVGRIVLHLVGISTPAAVRLSDRICTALQLIEHTQDVAQDRRAGRIYLPQTELATFGVAEADLAAPTATPAIRTLIAFQTARAAQLLDSGAPLVAMMRGFARLAIAGYVAGGRAAIDGIRHANWDVLSTTPQVRRRDVLMHLGLLLVHPGAAS